MKVNIPASVQDDHYRYTRDDLQCKVESSGNGIKTKLCNIENIAEALNRNVDNLCKYFSYQLNCAEKRRILKGKHSKGILDKTLEKYINDYVLCGKCKIPETEIICGSASMLKIGLKCSSCGSVTRCPNDQKFNKLVVKELRKKTKIAQKLSDSKKKVKLKWIAEDDFSRQNSLPVSELQEFLKTSDISELDSTKLLEYQMKCRLSDCKFMLEIVKHLDENSDISKITEILGDFIYAPFRQLALMQVLFSFDKIDDPVKITKNLYEKGFFFKEWVEQFAKENPDLSVCKCLA